MTYNSSKVSQNRNVKMTTYFIFMRRQLRKAKHFTFIINLGFIVRLYLTVIVHSQVHFFSFQMYQEQNPS